MNSAPRRCEAFQKWEALNILYRKWNNTLSSLSPFLSGPAPALMPEPCDIPLR